MNCTTVRSVVFVTIISLLLFAIPVMAGQASITIKPGTLQEALDAYSKATGTKTVYSNELVKGKNSPGAQNASPGDTLQKILQGTGLTFQMADNNTAVLKEKKPAAKQQKNKTGDPEPQQTSMEMQSITVTANKMEENIQNVPQSITVISDEVLKEKGIRNIPDVITEIPNMASMSSHADFVNFRGLNTSYFTSNNPVVIYIDGVPTSSQFGFDASMNNIERIEVLRGPQGTLYGKDAIGAVINIVTKEPGNVWHGTIGTEYASYNDIQGSFNVSGPLIQNKLYIGLNARYQQDDGWITNDYTGDDSANESDRYNLSGSLLYTPTERFTAKLVLSNDYSHRDYVTGYALTPGTDANEFDRDHAEHTSFDEDTFSETENLSQSLQLEYEFDSMTLNSTTTHRNLDYDSTNDRDYMANTAFDGLVGLSYVENDTWAEELRLSSNNTEGVRWIAGAYFEIDNLENGPYGIQFPFHGSGYQMNAESETDSKTMAVFGQTMIPFLDRFELTLGARYQRIDKEMDLDNYFSEVGVSSDPIYSLNTDENWDVLLPKAALTYQLNDNWKTYASVAKGYMPGGFNIFASSGSAEDNTFDPQQSTNYEIGVKGKLNRARLSAAVFYMDIEDLQFNKLENDVWVTDNAGGAHSLGAELELTYFLTDSIELTAALGIIKAEYDDYDNENGLVWDGESIESTPSHTARIGAAYFNPNGFYARGDVTSMGEIPYYNNVTKKFNELDSYITADVKVGYRFKGYDIYAYCNNLTDEEYINAIFLNSSKTLVTYGDPRTFGVGIRYNF